MTMLIRLLYVCRPIVSHRYLYCKITCYFLEKLVTVRW